VIGGREVKPDGNLKPTTGLNVCARFSAKFKTIIKAVQSMNRFSFFRENQNTETVGAPGRRPASKLFLFTVVLALGAAVSPPAARASIIVETKSGVKDGDGAVHAKATFTFGTNTLDIVVENLQTSYTAAGQAISGIIFQVTPAATGITFTGGTAVKIDVADGGSATYHNGISTPVATTRWHTATPSTNLIALGGGQPDEMIIGVPTTQTPLTYANFNGQDQFNPYLKQSATFHFTFTSGVTAASQVTGVKFEFGTGPDYTTTSNDLTTTIVLTAVPEPSTLGGAGFAALAGVGYGWRRRGKAAV
jgi:hypothetical protein